jgi:Tol biopolymer transport system component
MGEVWRARDSRLGREVALKLLPRSFAADADRLARFEREAKLLASLSHPNVATLFGLEQLDGQRVLVMELVPGEDLAERIRRGPIPVEEALPIAQQIAEALDGAHEKGIVHRDLKPSNVKLAPDGKVKVLDFGLAKAWGGDDAADSSAGLSRSPTLAQTGTLAGVILGTAGYMAPEQAAGRPVDRRADVWAFGVVLFEMLTGRPLFTGETASEVLASVIKEEPDWTRLPAGLPPGLTRLLRRCLRKKPRERLRDIGDARLEIEELMAAVDPTPAATAAPPRGDRRGLSLAWLIAVALAAAALAAFATHLLRRPVTDTRVLAFEVAPPDGSAFQLHSERPGVPMLSPDGRLLAFVVQANGNSSLYVRSLDNVAPRQVPGTENAQYPFWSPDSRRVGFFADGKLKTVQVVGDAGPPVVLCAANEMKGGSWSPGEVIVFAGGAAAGLSRVSAGGGEPTALTKLDPARRENSHRHPRFLPDGRRFLYLARRADTSEHSVMVGSLDGAPPRELVRSPVAAEYAAGHLLFVREKTLMARPFDPARLELSGEAFPVVDEVRVIAVGPIATALGVFSASHNGTLAYLQRQGSSLRQLVWRDAGGHYSTPQISPAGDMAAVEVTAQGGSTDIWLVDLGRGVRSRFTFGASDEFMPLWLPGGRSLVFGCMPGTRQDICRQDVDGTEARVLFASEKEKAPTSVSRDGRWLLFMEEGSQDNYDLQVLPLDGPEPRQPRPFLKTAEFDEVLGRFSPDGRYVVYMSDESGRMEVYVTAFPGPGRKWRVSSRGGTHPDWQADGRRIFYRGPDGAVEAVPVTVRGDGLDFGAGEPLFQGSTATRMPLIAPAPDGKRLLSVEETQTKDEEKLSVVVNWLGRRGR